MADGAKETDRRRQVAITWLADALKEACQVGKYTTIEICVEIINGEIKAHPKTVIRSSLN